MSKTTPIHAWERLDIDDPLTGASWQVVSAHHGHTMQVDGRVLADSGASSMLIVSCSCGEQFRMADVTVGKHLHNGVEVA